MPSHRVLIVEDNLDTLHTFAFLLRRDGHEVEFAINGYAALTIAEAFRPDIVLLDLGLPGLDGFEVCRRMKSNPQLRHIRVVAVTAYAEEEDRARSRAAGCERHVVKPVSPAALLELVNA